MQRFIQSLCVTLFLVIPVSSFAELSDYFVSTQWLADNRDNVVVLDARQQPLYLLGHIEGHSAFPAVLFWKSVIRSKVWFRQRHPSPGC